MKIHSNYVLKYIFEFLSEEDFIKLLQVNKNIRRTILNISAFIFISWNLSDACKYSSKSINHTISKKR